MDDQQLLRLSRWTRRWMRRRTPVMHRLCKLAARLACPKGTHRRLVVEFDGGQIVADTSTSLGWTLLFRGCHEPEIARLIGQLVPAGATCLDVGANIGAHALVMARAAGPSGRIVAFEPHPELLERLRENVALNGQARVEVVHAAVADRDGEADLFAYEPGAQRRGGSSLLPSGGSPRWRVPTLCGATIERRFRLGRCDFVKIDVEGYDGVVLRSLAGLIERERPALVFEHRAETWSADGPGLEATLAWLRGLQYSLLVVQRDATTPLAEPVPPSCEILAVPLPARSVLAGRQDAVPSPAAG